MNLRTGQKISGKSRKRDYEKRKMEQTAFQRFSKMAHNSVAGDIRADDRLQRSERDWDVLLDQAKAWMEEGIDGARDEAGDDGDVASDKKCGGTSAAETPEDGFWGH